MPIKFIWNEAEDDIDRFLYFEDNNRIKRQTDRFCTSDIIKKFELKPDVMTDFDKDQDTNLDVLSESLNPEELHQKFLEFVKLNGSMTEIDEEAPSSSNTSVNPDEKKSYFVYRWNKSLKLTNSELQLKVDKLNQAVESLEEQIEFQKDQIFKLNSKLKSTKKLSQEQEDFQEEYEKVVSEKSQLKESICSLNKLIEKHKKDENDAYKTMDKMINEKCILEESLNSMNKKNESLKLDCVKLQEDFMKLSEDFIHKEEEFEKISHLFQKERLSAIQFKSTCQHLKEEKKSLESQIQELKYQMCLNDKEISFSCSPLRDKQINLLSEIMEANLTSTSARNSLETQTQLNESLENFQTEKYQLINQNESLQIQISDLQMKLDKTTELQLTDEESLPVDVAEDSVGSLLTWCNNFLESHETAEGEADQKVTRDNFTIHLHSTIDALNLEIPSNKQKVCGTLSYLQNDDELKSTLNHISMACEQDQSSYRERLNQMKKSLNMMMNCLDKVKMVRFVGSICDYSKQIGCLYSEQIFLKLIKVLVNQISLFHFEKSFYQQKLEAKHSLKYLDNQMNTEKIEEPEHIEFSTKFIQLLQEPPTKKQKVCLQFDSIFSFLMSKLQGIGKFGILVSVLAFCVMMTFENYSLHKPY